MDTTLSASQPNLLDEIRTLTQERLAPRASKYDEGAANPHENWRDLWEHGWLAMSVPKDYGGMGLDTSTYVMVLEEIAKGCINTCMTLHMHSTVMKFIAALATPEQMKRLYPEVVEGGKLFASWGSEPAVSLGRNFIVETTIDPTKGGYAINGVKHFCTMAGAATYYMVWCALPGADMEAGLMLALVPAGNDGVRIIGDWNTLGMRGTVSPSAEFNNCFVGPEQILGEPGQATKVGVVESFGLGFGAACLGAATAALDFTSEFCKTRIYKPDPLPIAHDVTVQRHVAGMSVHLDSARSMLYQSASQWEDADVITKGILAAKAKYLCAEAALEATSKAIQVVGGRSISKSLPLERAFRDVRACTLMPPNNDAMLANIGKAQLGLAGTAFGLDAQEV
jgi:hypothetical protein